MAMQKQITTIFGFVATQAYCKVEQLTLPDKDTICFTVSSRMLKGKPVFATASYSCPYDMEGLNPFKQAYTFARSLPEFLDATDV